MKMYSKTTVFTDETKQIGKSQRLIAILSISLCLVLATTFGLQSLFKNKTDEHFVQTTQTQNERREVYAQIKEQAKQDLSKSKLYRSVVYYTTGEQALLDRYETEYFEGFYALLDANVEANQIVEYINMFFENKQDLVDTLKNIRERNQSIDNIDNIELARATKYIGWYTPTDKRGIDYLANEAIWTGVLTACFVAVAIGYAVVAVIATIPTFGLGTVVFTALSAIWATMAGIMWGASASATNAMEDATYYSSRGYSYGIYKNTGFLGLPTGYSVRL